MKIDEYVQQLPFSALLQMAESHAGELLIEPKETLSERFTSHLLERREIERCFSCMTKEEKVLLRVFLLHADDTYLNVHQLRGQARLGPEEVKFALDRLRNKGLVYAARRFWGEEVFALPSDLFRAWLHFLVSLECGDGAGDPIVASQVESVKVHPPVFLDVLHLLAFMQKQEVTLTQKGQIYKRYASRLEERLYFTREGGELAESLGCGNGEAVASALVLLLDLALRLGLILFEEGKVTVDSVRLQAWLGFTPFEASGQIYCAWRRYYADENSFFLPCLTVMESMAGAEWRTWDAVLQCWEKMCDGRLDGEKKVRGWELCLSWLNLWGYVEVGEWQGQTVWRWGEFSPWREEPQVEEKFFLQPDFEILVSAYLRLEKHWLLCLYSEVKRRDRVSIHVLERESLTQAMEMGHILPDVLRFLEENSHSGIPDNVRISLQDWGESYGRISLTDCVVMTCQDEGLAEEIGRLPELSRYILQRLSDTQFIVSRTLAPELLKALEKKGYAPRKRITYPEVNLQVQSEGDERQPEEDLPFTPWEWKDRRGLWALKREQAFYVINKTLPMPAGGMGSSVRLPSVWSQGLRHYHTSTLKQILLQCIRLKKGIRVEHSVEKGLQAKEVSFLPQALRNVQGRQEVEGIQRDTECFIALPLEEIQRIQVLT